MARGLKDHANRRGRREAAKELRVSFRVIGDAKGLLNVMRFPHKGNVKRSLADVASDGDGHRGMKRKVNEEILREEGPA
jgi:hypothetical protein